MSSLWCFVEGDQNPFSVNPLSDANVQRLKELIIAKKGVEFRGLNTTDLMLWKVCYF
jgi:hypothetical protein